MKIHEWLNRSLSYLIVLAIASILAGCGGSTAKPDQKPAATPTAGGESHKESQKNETTGKADTAAGLAELSVEDRAIAEKQKVCLVSDEPLGEHGKPVKIDVKGQTIFLCCAACEEPIRKDPDKYLAKLKNGGGK
jgi:YHS domain-containing protein